MIIHYLVTAFLMVVSNFLIFFFISRIVPSRLSYWKIVLVCLGLTLILFIRVYINTEHGLIFMIMQLVLTVCITVLMFSGRVWKKLVALMYFFVLAIFLEISMISFLSTLSGSTVEDWGIGNNFSPLMYSVSISSILLYIPLGFLSASIWRRITMRRFQPFYVLFLVMPLGQLATYVGFMFSEDIAFLTGVAVSLAGSVILLRYLLTHERLRALEAELGDTRRRVEIEQARKRELDKRSEEMAKVRHDFNNQLAVIAQLVHAGEDGDAQELIDSLARSVSEQGG